PVFQLAWIDKSVSLLYIHGCATGRTIEKLNLVVEERGSVRGVRILKLNHCRGRARRAARNQRHLSDADRQQAPDRAGLAELAAAVHFGFILVADMVSAGWRRLQEAGVETINNKAPQYQVAGAIDYLFAAPGHKNLFRKNITSPSVTNMMEMIQNRIVTLVSCQPSASK